MHKRCLTFMLLFGAFCIVTVHNLPQVHASTPTITVQHLDQLAPSFDADQQMQSVPIADISQSVEDKQDISSLIAEIGPMPTCPPIGPNGSYPRCGGHPCGCAPTH